MSKKKRIQVVAIVFLIIAVLLLIPNTEWSQNTSVFAFISLICGTVGSIISMFIPTNFIWMFDESAWSFDEHLGFKIQILGKKHGLGKSLQVQIFQINERKSFEMVMTDCFHDEFGNVTIAAQMRFKGKLIITS